MGARRGAEEGPRLRGSAPRWRAGRPTLLLQDLPIPYAEAVIGRRRIAPAAIAALLTVLAFPVHAQLFGGDDTARKQIAEQARRIDALSEQLTRVENSLKNLSSAPNPALALSQQLEQMRQEMNQLRGQLEVLGNEIQGASKRQRDMYLDLDTRMKRLEQAGAAPAAPAASSPQPPTAGAKPPSSPPPAAGTKPPSSSLPSPAPPAAAQAGGGDAEARAYDAAQGQRRIGNYPAAIAGFQHFVAQYPKSPLAHRAMYWIGDSQYNLRDFNNAIASQNKLIAAWPESASVPDALLNIASCQLELGDNAAARKTLDGLVARYPASDAAEKARRRLATLK
jgi:tol-pal system protein YbgF